MLPEYTVGLDVSHWQGKINFAAIHPNIRFVIVKATEGKGNVDKRHEINCDGFASVNRDLGAYHLGHFGDVDKEIQNYQSHVHPQAGLDPWLDLETARIDEGLDRLDEGVIDWLSDWHNEIGGGVYISPRGYRHLLEACGHRADEVLSRFGLWTCDRDWRNIGRRDPTDIEPWGARWDLWQWSSDEIVPGIRGCVDVNWRRV